MALLLSVAASRPAPPVVERAAVSEATIAPASPNRLFVSGHSLTDRPFPDYLAAIAWSAGKPLAWNMQHLFGSSLQDRTRGAGGWTGYLRGVDRDGRPVDVLREMRAAAPAYDALILAERHSLIESLVWHDTIGSVLDYEARFRAASPHGRTYLISSWLNVDRLPNPQRWIAYEAAAAPAWRCVAAQVNRSLAARGLGTRVTLIPAADGLAALVSAALRGELAGSGVSNPRAMVSALFADDVHLTDTGTYYIALLAYGMMHGSLPPSSWAPPGIERSTARALRRFAAGYLARSPEPGLPTSDTDCDAYLAAFVPHYLSYVRDVRWRRQGLAAAHLKWLRFRIAWPRLFHPDSLANPLRVHN